MSFLMFCLLLLFVALKTLDTRIQLKPMLRDIAKRLKKRYLAGACQSDLKIEILFVASPLKRENSCWHIYCLDNVLLALNVL